MRSNKLSAKEMIVFFQKGDNSTEWSWARRQVMVGVNEKAKIEEFIEETTQDVMPNRLINPTVPQRVRGNLRMKDLVQPTMMKMLTQKIRNRLPPRMPSLKVQGCAE